MKKTLLEEQQRIFRIIESLDEERDADRYKNLMDFIGNSSNYSTYLHTTLSEETCQLILKEGFIFEEFRKTTDPISDVVSLTYMLLIRKQYGNFTIIIQINDNVRDKTYEEISKQNEDDTFTLPPKYVKGYYNRETQEIVSNPLFGN